MKRMAGGDSERDAEFFTAIWKSLCADAGMDVSQEEKRGSARFPFETVQLLAPLDGEAMPSSDSFTKIQCHDISSGGFSYYAEDDPDSERFVLLLLTGDVKRCIECRVAHSRPIYRNGVLQFVVGCEFVQRVEFS